MYNVISYRHYLLLQRYTLLMKVINNLLYSVGIPNTID